MYWLFCLITKLLPPPGVQSVDLTQWRREQWRQFDRQVPPVVRMVVIAVVIAADVFLVLHRTPTGISAWEEFAFLVVIELFLLGMVSAIVMYWNEPISVLLPGGHDDLIFGFDAAGEPIGQVRVETLTEYDGIPVDKVTTLWVPKKSA